ncbi:MAG TPA: hypothetical protein VJQ44_19430 [Gemmatimonadales bacterium]|nr:hypothetical protein [Gemmatimonadales bacterium]
MRRPRQLSLPLALILAAACSNDTGPGPSDPGDGDRLAAEFENLAGELGDSGATASANALYHAAQLVRMVGHATPITVTIDGVTHDWLAVGEQLDYPLVECVWPVTEAPGEGDAPPSGGEGATPPDSASGGGSAGGGTGGSPGEPVCSETGTSSVRSIIAWEPEHMDEVVRMTAEPGSSEVKPAGVPDVMAGIPEPSGATEPGDTAITGGGTYGFMGEYLKADGGIFWTVEGTQSNSRESGTGACTQAHVSFDWVEFDCDAARLRFQAEMRVEGGQIQPLTGRPASGESGSGGIADLETHTISIPATTVDGAVMTVVGWTAPTPQPGAPPEPGGPPEPGPGPDPIPVDSSSTN